MEQALSGQVVEVVSDLIMSHCLFLVTDSVCWIQQHLCLI